MLIAPSLSLNASLFGELTALGGAWPVWRKVAFFHSGSLTSGGVVRASGAERPFCFHSLFSQKHLKPCVLSTLPAFQDGLLTLLRLDFGKISAPLCSLVHGPIGQSVVVGGAFTRVSLFQQ